MAVPAKITDKSKKIIREIVRDTGESQISVIEHAVMAYHREWRIQKVNEAYAKLRSDQKAWSAELKERSLWEHTSEDGLDND